MSSYFTIGSTGFVGSYFLNRAVDCEKVSKIVTLTRKEPNVNSPKLNKVVEKNSDVWSETIASQASSIPEHSTFFSSFGTTRSIAGSAENFIKIDYGINYECLKAAKETGKFDTVILVSSIGANKDSRFLYTSTKGKLDDDLIELKFKRTIILRPGILLGHRNVSKGWNNSFAEKIGSCVRGTFIGNMIGYPVYADEVAECALKLSLEPIKEENEVLIISSKEIIELASKDD